MGWTNADNKFGPSSFIVTTPAAGLGNGANYTSIQTAINEATPGSCIYIRGGTYIEANITLKTNVALYGVPDSTAIGGGPVINGNIILDASLTPNTVSRLENIHVISTAADAFEALNAGLIRVEIVNCTFSGGAGFNGINIHNSSGTFSSVNIRGGTIGGDTGLLIQNHNFVNVFDSIINGSVAGGVSLNGSSRAFLSDCTITGNSTSAVICNGTALQTIGCQITAGGSLGYELNAGTTFVYGCIVDSTDPSGFWVSGVGQLNYANVINLQNNLLDPGTPILVYDWKPYADTAGTIGTCTFNSTDFSVVNGLVSSSSGTGFVQTISGDGATATPTAGNISLVSQSGANLGFSAPSTILIRAPLYTQSNVTGLMGENTVDFTTGAITRQLPATIQDGLCNGVVVTDASVVVLTPFNGTSKIRVGTQLSAAGGTATSSGNAGDVLVLRYDTVSDVWYGVEVIGTWNVV